MQDNVDWVYDFFAKRVQVPGKSREQQLALDIFDGALIDSFGVVELISEIESSFNIQLTSEDMEDQRFRTIQGLGEIISQRQQQA